MRQKKRDGIWRLEPSEVHGAPLEVHGPAECAGLLGLELGGFIPSLGHAWHPGKARGGGFNRYAHSAGPILVKRDQGNDD